MKIQELIAKENKDVVISIRTTKTNFSWLKKKKISPTLLFNKALEEIMDDLNNTYGSKHSSGEKTR